MKAHCSICPVQQIWVRFYVLFVCVKVLEVDSKTTRTYYTTHITYTLTQKKAHFFRTVHKKPCGCHPPFLLYTCMYMSLHVHFGVCDCDLWSMFYEPVLIYDPYGSDVSSALHFRHSPLKELVNKALPWDPLPSFLLSLTARSLPSAEGGSAICSSSWMLTAECLCYLCLPLASVASLSFGMCSHLWAWW